MRAVNQQIMTNVVLNADRNSDPIPLQNIFMFSLCAIINGTPTGGIKLQVSNDPISAVSNNVTPTNWVDMSHSQYSLTDDTPTFWNVSEVAYNYVRVVYNDLSGGTSTATLSLVFNGKGQ
jgi:hypothetical protein